MTTPWTCYKTDAFCTCKHECAYKPLGLFSEDPETPHAFTVDEVMQALQRLRVTSVTDEYELQSRIAQCLDDANIRYEKEYRLGPRCRTDFFVEGGIVIEVKRGREKPNQTRVTAQLERYAAFDDVTALILVVDRNLHLPEEIAGKACTSLGLHKLWGISL